MGKRYCYKKDCTGEHVIEQFSMICPSCEEDIKKKAKKELLGKLLESFEDCNNIDYQGKYLNQVFKTELEILED